MIYSLTQQLLCQQPRLALLNMACRSDHAFSLLVYPYITRYSTEKSPQKPFIHLDGNVHKMASDGTGTSRVATAVSFLDETKDTCIFVVPGSHKFIEEWSQMLYKDGITLGDRPTTSDEFYTKYEGFFKQKYNAVRMPVPCKTLQVRMTRSDVVHGATPQFNSDERMVAFLWYTKVSDPFNGHDKLEIPGQHTWTQLSGHYALKQAPDRGINGNAVTKDKPPFPFPAEVHFPSSSAFTDALICRRPWTDPEAISELNILLSHDDNAALMLIHKIESHLISNFKAAFIKFFYREIEVFQENSYFKKNNISLEDLGLTE